MEKAADRALEVFYCICRVNWYGLCCRYIIADEIEVLGRHGLNAGMLVTKTKLLLLKK